MSKNLCTVTVATKDGGYYDCLKKLCERNSIDLHVLGWQVEWKGFAWRWKLYDEFVESLSDDTIVMWIDAYDVLIVDKGSSIIEKFKKFNKGIVFGVEKSFLSDLFFSVCDKHVINGGSHIGYVKYIKEMIKIMRDPYLMSKWNHDDQNMLNELNCTHPFFDKHVGRDYDSDIFYVTGSSERFNTDYMTKGKLDLTDKYPSVIHGNGNINLDRYVKLLGCDMEKVIKPESSFKLKQVKNLTKNMLRINKTLCVLLCLMISVIVFVIIS
jgi:hypothetical protein